VLRQYKLRYAAPDPIAEYIAGKSFTEGCC
jgi:hypothetical protein